MARILYGVVGEGHAIYAQDGSRGLRARLDDTISAATRGAPA